MASNYVPRRSVLYMPGSNERAISKARELPCDAIILDLEDAVASDAKDHARELVGKALEEDGFGYREVIVRVNGLDTPWGKADLDMVAKHTSVAGVLLPKVETTEEIALATRELDFRGGQIPLWIMVETPRGVLNLEATAGHERVTVLVMGTSDLVQELRARHTRERHNLSYTLQRSLLIGRANGCDVLDGVHLDFRNLDSFRDACTAARDMGFDGKTLIHPTQIDVANEIFGVSEEAAEQARRVLEAWEAAQSSGKGVVEVDGQLVENLHAVEAQRIISIVVALEARH